VHRRICRNPNFRISQKTPIGKEKVTIQGEGTQKLVAHFPYRRRHVDIIYRISRGILKHTKVVGTGLNQKFSFLCCDFVHSVFFLLRGCVFSFTLCHLSFFYLVIRHLYFFTRHWLVFCIVVRHLFVCFVLKHDFTCCLSWHVTSFSP